VLLVGAAALMGAAGFPLPIQLPLFAVGALLVAWGTGLVSRAVLYEALEMRVPDRS